MRRVFDVAFVCAARESQRHGADGHARHLAGILNHRRGNPLIEHQMAFEDVVQHAAVGEEAAAVVDDDGRLLDGILFTSQTVDSFVDGSISATS